MIRAAALVFLCCVAASAERDGRDAEAHLLARWANAGPAERMRLRAELDRIERERGFVEARCVLIELDERTYSLAEIFRTILEPALDVPARARSEQAYAEGEIGLREEHRKALAALVALRKVHAAPAPVSTQTLNVLLGYAGRVLDAWRLSPRLRLRMLMEVLRNVNELEGRATPDARTGWTVNERILPALVGLARRYEDDGPMREAVSRAASMLTMPSVLDGPAVARLAALTRGGDAREVLLRAYRRGDLEAMGVTALARSVIAQGRDDAAFLAGAAPVILELLGDPRVSAPLRGELVDLVLRRYGAVEPLKPLAEELLAGAYGLPPRSLAEWRKLRKGAPGALPRPPAGETFRFLQVVLLRPRSNAPPAPARVVRADVALNRTVRGDRNAFVGQLVPAPGGESADFLGPTPGLRAVDDNRLVRRTLQLERISMRTFGARDEEIELCVALPRDGSEPVPVAGARLSHVLDLIRVRLERTQDASENRSLVDLLVRIDTPQARAMALTFARGEQHAASLLELLEGGDGSAAAPLLERLADLSESELERALGAILARKDRELRARIGKLAAKGPIELAAPAADALLQAGDAAGVRALLQHEDRYARLCGVALALRMTVLAGGIRVTPRQPIEQAELVRLVKAAFPKEMGGCWRRLGAWLPVAFGKPEEVRSLRGHAMLYAGKGVPKVTPARFADVWTGAIRDGKHAKSWPWVAEYVLTPRNPGRAMKPAALRELLDALESRAAEGKLRRAWIDSLSVLAAVQSGLEFDTEFLGMADRRLRKAAGKSAPAMAQRRPGLAWPIWAARDAAGR